MEKPNVRLVSGAVTDKGLSGKRPVNEDSYLEMPERGLFAVADGVGGAQAGDFASQTAMEVLQDAFSHSRSDVDTEELLEMAITRGNASIYQMSHELPQLEEMATTIVTLHLDGNIATIGHVGDSRLYRLDARGNLFRETNDHSMVEEEVRAGRMTEKQAANHPSRNVINRALGASAEVEVEMRTIMFDLGTTFLLCSDGVTRHIQDHELREILRRCELPADACREIKALCFSRGAEDNLTAIVVRAEDAQVYAPVRDEDENTISGVRPVFAPDPLPTLSNNSQAQQRGAAQTQARTDEFAAIPFDNPDAPTAPLEPIAALRPEQSENDTILKPASQTIGLSGASAVPITASDATLPSKLENERIRAKINAAEPLDDSAVPARTAAGGKIFSSLLLLFIGAALGASLLYAWSLINPPTTTAPTTSQTAPITVPPVTSAGDLSPAEVNEFRTFERVRRSVDNAPQNAQTAMGQPAAAADYYLRGRAFLLLGKNEEAREDFGKASELLAQSSDNVTPETLRVDIAVAQAAVGALTLTSGDRKMLQEIVKNKQTPIAVDNQTTQPVR